MDQWERRHVHRAGQTEPTNDGRVFHFLQPEDVNPAKPAEDRDNRQVIRIYMSTSFQIKKVFIIFLNHRTLG